MQNITVNKRIMVVVAVVFMAFWLFAGAVMSYKEIHPVKADLSAVPMDDSSHYTWDLHEDDDGHFLTIYGWFVKNGYDTNLGNLKISFAYRDDKDSWYVFPADVTNSKAAAKYLDDGLRYKWSGISARFLKKYMNENSAYQKYVLYELNDERVLVPID